ncbi:MAG: hypothetical protein AAGF12_11770 [Myxococcota bacterium]
MTLLALGTDPPPSAAPTASLPPRNTSGIPRRRGPTAGGASTPIIDQAHAGEGLVGAGIWYAVRAVSGYELGLLALLVGFMVGYAVRTGAYGMGGRFYQGLAVVVTYVAICLTYIPDIAAEMMAPVTMDVVMESETPEASESMPAEGFSSAELQEREDVVQADPIIVEDGLPPVIAYVIAVPFSLALPVMAPIFDPGSGLISLLIIGIALWQAWKLNKRAA